MDQGENTEQIPSGLRSIAENMAIMSLVVGVTLLATGEMSEAGRLAVTAATLGVTKLIILDPKTASENFKRAKGDKLRVESDKQFLEKLEQTAKAVAGLVRINLKKEEPEPEKVFVAGD
jgi:formylmethanofuran dehydrogenase subunit E